MRDVANTVADAVVDRIAIDWRTAEGLTPGPDAAVLRSLQDIATLAGSRTAADGFSRVDESVTVSTLAVVLACLGAVVAAAGLCTAVVRIVLTGNWQWMSQLVVVASFSGAAAALVLVARREARVVDYAALLLLTASAFARPLLAGAPVLPYVGAALAGVYPEVFLPAAMWGWARRFPHAYRFSLIDRAARVAGTAAVLFGAAALAASFVVSRDPALSSSKVPAPFLRSNPLGGFWLFFYALLLPALLCVFARCWYAERVERRRVAVFGTVLASGVVPIVVAGVLQVMSPRYRELNQQHALLPRLVDTLVWTGLISIPLTTSFAIALRGALPIRRVASDALRLVIARHSLRLLSAALVLVVTARFIRDRDRPLTDSLHWVASYPLIAAVVLLILFISHRRLARWIDAVFGRRPIDHERLAADAVVRVSSARDRVAAAVAVAHELRQAFDPRSIEILVRGDRQAWTPAGTGGLPLPVESSLPWLAASHRDGVSVGPSSPSFDLLPKHDQNWILRSGADVIACIGSADPWGLVGIGVRPDGQPYDRSDKLLITTITGAAAHASAAEDGVSAAIGESPAIECPACGVVSSSSSTGCECRVEPVLAALPKVVAGKFDVLRRVGRGGMGVVYVASDRLIGRPVAVKTVQVSSPDRTERVLNEARAMAAAVHPNLAQIHSVELVLRAPVLVVEWMPGGTLADRLRAARLSWREALTLGLGVGNALAHLHAAGLVHRDVKPSNIGFGADGTPKLLDFGLASAVAAANVDHSAVAELGVEGDSAAESLSLAGTPLYLSPDLLAGGPGGAHQDLWALALVLYESIAGSNPFRSDSVRATIRRIRTMELPGVRDSAPGTPAPVAMFLAACLGRDRARRPATATKMTAILSELLTSGPVQR